MNLPSQHLFSPSWTFGGLMEKATWLYKKSPPEQEPWGQRSRGASRGSGQGRAGGLLPTCKCKSHNRDNRGCPCYHEDSSLVKGAHVSNRYTRKDLVHSWRPGTGGQMHSWGAQLTCQIPSHCVPTSLATKGVEKIKPSHPGHQKFSHTPSNLNWLSHQGSILLKNRYPEQPYPTKASHRAWVSHPPCASEPPFVK